MSKSECRRFWVPRQRPVAVAMMAIVVVALAGCSSAVPSPPGRSATTSAEVSAPSVTRLDDAINRVMKDASIPGAIVGIWGPAGNYVRAFGVAYKATHAPMQTDFCWRIGSVTKTFTVTAVLQLVDQGRLKLNDPISKYISGVPSGDRVT
jgi:D-alanyl-D-alanine carboxypeptidase